MKKWTYLVAAGMLLGATPVFTGCIDNDEPEGITILRGAKAELLKAKASVEAARVEQIKADAALTLAKAKISEAEAENMQAQTEYQKALTLKAQYEAEKVNIKNEEERANLEKLIAENAALIAEAEARAQKAAEQLKIDLLELQTQLLIQQAAYETALKDLALAKNTLTAAQQAYLQKWITAVNSAQADVKTKTGKYAEALDALAEATKTMDKEEAKKTYLRTETKAVADAKANWEAATAAKELAKEYVDKKIDAADKWEEEMQKLDAELKELDKKLADLAVEKTKLETSTKGEAEEMMKLRQSYMDLTGYEWDAVNNEFKDEIGTSQEAIDLKDIEIKINEPGLRLYGEFTISENYLYSDYLKALKNGDEFQLYSKSRLNNLIDRIKGCALTPNDVAWTEEYISQYSRTLENQKVATAELKAQWELAVKAYKGLEYGDPTILPDFDKVETAVAAYNDAVKKFNSDVNALNTFMTEKLQAALDAHQEKLEEIQAAYEKALADNKAEYEATFEKTTKNISSLLHALETAWANYDKLKTEYDQIANPKPEDAKAYQDAKKVYDNAEKAYNQAYDAAWGYLKQNDDGTHTWIEGSISKAGTLKDNKDIIAEKDKSLARAKEMEEYFKVNPNNALENEYNEMSNAIYAQDGSYDIMFNAYKETKDNLETFYHGFSLSSNLVNINAAYYNYDSEGNWIPQTIEAKDAARIEKYTLQNRITDLSRNLYGFNHTDRLVELTVEEINAEIEAQWMADHTTSVPYYYYNQSYTSYGAVGLVEYYDSLIKQGKAALANKAKIDELVKEMEGYLAEIEEQIAAYTKEVVEPAGAAYTTAYETLMAKFEEVDKQIRDANSQKYAKKPVLDKINAAISTYLAQEMKPDGTPVSSTTIENLRKELQEIYDNAVNDEYEKETLYLEAQDALQAVIDGTKEPVEAAKEKAEKALAALQAAQTELSNAAEALQAEIERISATAEE